MNECRRKVHFNSVRQSCKPLNYPFFNGIRNVDFSRFFAAVSFSKLLIRDKLKLFTSICGGTKRECTSRCYLSLLRDGERRQDVGEGPERSVHVESWHHHDDPYLNWPAGRATGLLWRVPSDSRRLSHFGPGDRALKFDVVSSTSRINLCSSKRVTKWYQDSATFTYQEISIG